MTGHDEHAARWGRRAAVGVTLSALALLATTGHEHTDNGRADATPVAAVCWVEPNDLAPEGVELLQGTDTQRPARSVVVPCP